MNRFIIIILLAAGYIPALRSQNGVGIGTASPHASAALEVASTSKGILVPRLSTVQRTNLSSPATGLLVFDADTESFWFRGASGWIELIDASNDKIESNGNDIYMAMDGNVGIGTNTPAAKLHVHAPSLPPNAGIFHATNATVAAQLQLGAAHAAWITTTNHPLVLSAFNKPNQLFLAPNGHVAINTNTPVKPLHVAGGAYISGHLGIGNINPTVPLSLASTIGEKISLFGDSTANFGLGIAPGAMLIHSNQPTADIAFGHGSAMAFVEKIRIKGTGRLGIGTSEPLQAFSINNKFMVDDSGTVHYKNDVPRMMYLFNGQGAAVNKMVVSHSPAFHDWGLEYLTSDNKFKFKGGANNVMTVDLGGSRVGIGTDTPGQKLDVAGKLHVRDSIGIGVTNPQLPLSFPQVTGGKISLYGNAAANFGFGVSPAGVLLIHSNQSNADIAFGYGSTSAFTERVRITGTGRLGIGTNNPAQMLDVAGNARVTGDIIIEGSVTAGYQIVSQNFAIDPGATENVTCVCPGGKKAIGGGWDGPLVSVTRSQPVSNGSGWTIRAFNLDPFGIVPVTVTVVCARVN